MRKSFLLLLLAISSAMGHVFYPLALSLASRRGEGTQPPAPDKKRGVTVVVPAYLELGVIQGKVADVLANGYEGDLEVIVVADGDPDTAAAAARAGARVILLPERGGKSQALNRGVEEARFDCVVLTDANNRLEPHAIERLAQWFGDPTVGAVAGEKHEGAGGELAYWRFESWLKRQEFALGSTLGIDGGLCAIRRSAWRPIPADISTDDLWIALDMMERGHRVAYEPGALVQEESIGDINLSWERRTRVLGASMWVFWRKRHLLVPRAGLVSAEIWGHRLWRSTLGPLSHATLLGWALRASGRSRWGAAFVLGNAAASLSLLAQEKGVKLPLPARIAAQIIFLQAVAIGGMCRFLLGDRSVKWRKPER